MSLSDIFGSKSADSGYQPLVHPIPANEPAAQVVNFLFIQKPVLDKDLIANELQGFFSEVVDVSDNDALAFLFPEYTFKPGAQAAGGTILAEVMRLAPGQYDNACEQAWHWPEASAETGSCQYQICLQEQTPEGLSAGQRLAFFQRFVWAVIRATRPAVVYFRHSNKLLAADDFMNALANENPAFLYGAMSVRRVQLANGAILMDTLGLHILGLPDFECLCGAYSPAGMAVALTDAAYEMFETDAVVNDISAVQGIGEGTIWPTRLEASKTQPARLVQHIVVV